MGSSAGWVAWAIISAVLTLAGLIAAIIGLRGRRIGDTPHCARCGFDLTGIRAAPILLKPNCRLARRQQNLDGEGRALSRGGADADAMTQQIPQALHDGETETEAAALFAHGIVELMVLLENRLKFLAGDAESRRCQSARRSSAFSDRRASRTIRQCPMVAGTGKRTSSSRFVRPVLSGVLAWSPPPLPVPASGVGSGALGVEGIMGYSVTG